MALSFSGVRAVGFTVWVLREACLLLGTIKWLPWKGFVSIKFCCVSMASQSAGVLLISRIGDSRGSVMEKVLDVMRWVLKARRCCPGSVHQRVATGNALWKPAVVVSWIQRFGTFVLGKKGVNKIGAHD